MRHRLCLSFFLFFFLSSPTRFLRVDQLFLFPAFSPFTSRLLSAVSCGFCYERVHRNGARYPRRGTGAGLFSAGFRPFQGNRSHGTEEHRKNGGNGGGHCAVLRATDEGAREEALCIGGTDRESGTSICTRRSSCSRRENTVHDSGISRGRCAALRDGSVYTCPDALNLSDILNKKRKNEKESRNFIGKVLNGA